MLYQIPIDLIQEISISLLLTSLAPAMTGPFFRPDTSRIQTVGNELDNPALLVTDSTQRAFPVYFCGEELPVSEPRVARRWVQVLRTYGAQQECLFSLRQRASQFFPVIDPILRKYKIPRDFRFLPLAESELVNDCVSPKGASGYWQLMPGTARELGLTVSGKTDERYNLEKATIAVCHHLHKLYRELGSWTLVAAAYNAGITHVQKTMAKQKHANYYRLRLHRETSHYLFRVLAYKELLSNPRQYALMLKNSTMEQLIKPLPSWHKPLAVPRKIKDSPTIELVDDDAIDPTWGPRPNTALTKAPSDTRQWLESALSLRTGTNGIDEQNTELPIRKVMMGLTVLRFRRPRFLRKKASGGVRPLHFWDWI